MESFIKKYVFYFYLGVSLLFADICIDILTHKLWWWMILVPILLLAYIYKIDNQNK